MNVQCVGFQITASGMRNTSSTTRTEEMQIIIAARIKAGMSAPDPEKRASRERIPRAGEIPIPEEWHRYAVE